jgi:hypothetical protein
METEVLGRGEHALPVAFLLGRRRGPAALLRLPPRPGPRRLPALLAAIALPGQSRLKPLLTSFEQTPSRPRPARQPLAQAARLIFGMACRTLGRAQGRSLLPEALSRRGRHSPSGAAESSHQNAINNSIAEIGCPLGPRLSAVHFFPARGGAVVTFRRPVPIVSFETSSVRLVSTHRYTALAARSGWTAKMAPSPAAANRRGHSSARGA